MKDMMLGGRGVQGARVSVRVGSDQVHRVQPTKRKSGKPLKTWRALWQHPGSCRICSLSCWCPVLLWSSIPHCVPFSSLSDGTLYPVLLYVGSVWSVSRFWLCKVIQLRHCHESQKRCWVFKQGWDCDRLWGLLMLDWMYFCIIMWL